MIKTEAIKLAGLEKSSEKWLRVYIGLTMQYDPKSLTGGFMDDWTVYGCEKSGLLYKYSSLDGKWYHCAGHPLGVREINNLGEVV